MNINGVLKYIQRYESKFQISDYINLKLPLAIDIGNRGILRVRSELNVKYKYYVHYYRLRVTSINDTQQGSKAEAKDTNQHMKYTVD